MCILCRNSPAFQNVSVHTSLEPASISNSSVCTLAGITLPALRTISMHTRLRFLSSCTFRWHFASSVCSSCRHLKSVWISAGTSHRPYVSMNFCRASTPVRFLRIVRRPSHHKYESLLSGSCLPALHDSMMHCWYFTSVWISAGASQHKYALPYALLAGTSHQYESLPALHVSVKLCRHFTSLACTSVCASRWHFIAV